MLKKRLKFSLLVFVSLLVLQSVVFSFDRGNTASAAPRVEYLGQAKYGIYTVMKFRVDGKVAFCVDHHLTGPPTGTSYKNSSPYNNEKIKAILYYGYGGPENIVGTSDTAIVATTIALDSVMNNEWGSYRQQIPGYNALIEKANAHAAPSSSASFSRTTATSSISGSVQKSQTVVFNADSKNSVKLSVPSGVTMHLGSSSYSNRTVTVKGGQSFYFTAPLDYGKDLTFSNVKPTMGTYQPLLFIPYTSSYQRLGQGMFTDPAPLRSLTIDFEVRQKKITVQHLDEYDNKLLDSESYTRNIGSSYSFSPQDVIISGGNRYLPVSKTKKTGTVGSSDILLKFYYNLERTITVNHIDARDNRVIATSSEKALRGDTYSYSPRTDLKKGSYTYRPLSTAKKSGTVGAKNIVIDFYYDVPVIKTGLEKIQVYTAPADEGLPVKVRLSKVNVYPDTIEDMSDVTLNVALYKGGTRIDSNTYSAKTLPTNINFTVPSSRLSVNEKSPYTVKLESFSKDDIDVIPSAAEITTDGYSSSERNISVDLDSSNKTVLDYTGVVMTEREIGRNMNVFYEQFSIPLQKLEKMRTGYGFEMPIDVTYSSDIPTNKTSFGFEMLVPTAVTDDTFISYAKQSSNSLVKMDRTRNTTNTSSSTTSTQKFELQKVFVEKETGHLFSNTQKLSNDQRIKNQLVDGGRKLYLDAWSEVNKYPVQVKSNKSMGINLVNVSIKQDLDVFAHMYAHMDSETIEDDAILFVPVDKEDPFPEGLPDGWTTSDLAWINGK